MMEYTSLRNICLFLGLISIMLSSYSCTVGEINELSDIPRIQLLSLSGTTITEFEDELIIQISYEDGNGDIGFEETDQFALFVRDIRLEEFDAFYVGPVAPPNVNIPIQGTLNIEFPNLFVFGNSQSETTRFEIKLIDRAMNESNILMTDPVTITK